MMFRGFKSDQALDLFDVIRSDVFDAMDVMGGQIADAWQEEISIDVEYGQNAFGQYEVVVRSAPGESPRRESGDLYESIDARTATDDQVVTTEVDTDIEYGYTLEVGRTNCLPRPHRTPIFERFADPMIDAVVNAITRR